MTSEHLDALPPAGGEGRNGPAETTAASLARYFLEAHEVVLGKPCSLTQDRVEAEIDEALALLETPAKRLHSALTFAIETLRARGEAAADLRFLRRFAFRDQLHVRRLIGEALRGGRSGPSQNDSPLGEEDLIQGFLRYLRVEEGRTEHTVRSYGEGLTVLRAFLGERRLDVRDVTRDDLIAFKESLMRRGNSARTVNLRLAAASALYRYLTAIHELEQDPTQTVRRLPEQHRKMSIWSAAEFEQLLDQVDVESLCGARDFCLIVALFATAGRVGEVAALRLCDLDLDKAIVTFRQRKNKHDNRVCIPAAAVAAFAYYLKEVRPKFVDKAQVGCEDLVFLTKTGRRISRENASRNLKRYAAAAGIHKHISPHTFRRSVATTLANNQMPAELIKSYLGHQSIDTTLRNYVAYSEITQRRAIDEHHPLSEQEPWPMP